MPPKKEPKCRPADTLPQIKRGFLKLGPKHFAILVQFLPSAVRFLTAALIGVTYMTDWKTVLRYMPYYNGKYEDLQTAEDNAKE